MIPARRGQGFGFTVRINNLYLFLCCDFSDGKKRTLKFLFKSTRNFICILRCYCAQQGVILSTGKRVAYRVKIKTGSKIFQVLRNWNFVRIQARPHPAFFGNMCKIRTQTVAGIDGGMNAALPGEESSFAQMGFRCQMGVE